MSAIQICRYLVSFSWIYQGIFPKLVHVAPVEQLMTASFGFSDSISYWITKSAGIAEVLFGLALFFFYQSRLLLVINMVALTGLLAFVAVVQPQLLIEAFNPVTTNLPMIGLSLILLLDAGRAPKTSAG